MNFLNSPKIIISACLLNKKVRHDGVILNFHHPFIDKLLKKKLLIPFCPEVEAGMGVPRIPVELQMAAEKIWRTRKGVVNQLGEDVTNAILQGIVKIDEVLKTNDVRFAILKENSPTCGIYHVYDGRFTGKLVNGNGIFSYYLDKKGVKIFAESELERLEKILIEKHIIEN